MVNGRKVGIVVSSEKLQVVRARYSLSQEKAAASWDVLTSDFIS
jgi:hypothetical protein